MNDNESMNSASSSTSSSHNETSSKASRKSNRDKSKTTRKSHHHDNNNTDDDRKAKERSRRRHTDTSSLPGAHASSGGSGSKRERSKRDADAKDKERRHRHSTKSAANTVVGAVSVFDADSNTRERRKADRERATSTRSSNSTRSASKSPKPSKSRTSKREQEDADVKSKRRNRHSTKPSKPGAQVVTSDKASDDVDTKIKRRNRHSSPKPSKPGAVPASRSRNKPGLQNEVTIEAADASNPTTEDEMQVEAITIEDLEEGDKDTSNKNTAETPALTENEIRLQQKLAAAQARIEEQQQELLAERQKKKPIWKNPLVIFVVLAILIGGGVGAYFGLSKSATTEEATADTSNTTDTLSPTDSPVINNSTVSNGLPSLSPTSSPTNSPLFDQASPEKCQETAQGQVSDDDRNEPVTLKLKMTLDLVLDLDTESIDTESLASQLQTALQSYLIPVLAGCQVNSLQGQRLLNGSTRTSVRKRTSSVHRKLTLPPNIVSNGLISLTVVLDEKCENASATCANSFVDMDLYLKANAKFYDIIGLVSQALPGNVAPILDVQIPPFIEIYLQGIEPGTNTLAPSAVPTNVASEQPSFEPTVTASAPPSTAPVSFPTPPPTVAPTVRTSQTPTSNPSITPSGTPSTPSPTTAPNPDPTPPPSQSPTKLPSETPSSIPSLTPSIAPSLAPSARPSSLPSKQPSAAPSNVPSQLPTVVSSMSPSAASTGFDRATAVTSILTSRSFSLTSAAADWIINTDTWYPSTDAEALILDRLALASLYLGTNGSGWTTRTNWMSPTTSVCSWFGVTCDGNRVSQLILEKIWMNGDIPTEFSALEHIKHLQMFQGTITSGTFPPAIFDLTSLTHLRFQTMELSNHPLPSEISKLSNIEYMNINGGHFTGSIPTELFSLTKLQLLRVGGNYFTPGMATIPTEVGQLTALTELTMMTAQLTGTIPDEIQKLTNLSYIHFGVNSLTGLGRGLHTMSNLRNLVLQFNPHISSTFPSEILEMDQLQSYSMQFSELSGPIPTDIGRMTSLTKLILHGNDLTGTVPVLPPLTQCWLYDNDFQDTTNAANRGCRLT